jgi:hypothetical protein
LRNSPFSVLDTSGRDKAFALLRPDFVFDNTEITTVLGANNGNGNGLPVALLAKCFGVLSCGASSEASILRVSAVAEANLCSDDDTELLNRQLHPTLPAMYDRKRSSMRYYQSVARNTFANLYWSAPADNGWMLLKRVKALGVPPLPIETGSLRHPDGKPFR